MMKFEGLMFHSYNKDGKMIHQGKVKFKITDEKYLVQAHDFISGQANVMYVVTLDEMTKNKWAFFEDNEDGQEWKEFFLEKYRSKSK